MDINNYKKNPNSLFELYVQTNLHETLKREFGSDQTRSEIISLRTLFGSGELDLGKAKALREWYMNTLEVQIYKVHQGFSFSPNGPRILSHNEPLSTREEVLEYLDVLGYEEVRFLFNG